MEYSKQKYLAFALSAECRESLLKKIKPSHDVVVCHHVTLMFNGRQETFDALVRDLKPTSFEAVGIADHDGVQALLVEANGDYHRADGSYYHVTHSHAENRKPVDSNRVLKELVPKGLGLFEKPIKLVGEIKLLSK